MKRGIPFPTKTEADEASAELARSLGYPLAGRDVGGGIHAPPEQSATVRPYDVIECVDGTFVVPTDAEIEKTLAPDDVAKIATVEEKPPPPDPKSQKP